MGGSTNRCYWFRSSWCFSIAGSNDINPTLYHNQVVITPPQPHADAITDTGSTGTYISPTHIHLWHNIYQKTKAPTVKATDGNCTTPMKTNTLHLLLHIPDHAQQGHVINSPKNRLPQFNWTALQWRLRSYLLQLKCQNNQGWQHYNIRPTQPHQQPLYNYPGPKTTATIPDYHQPAPPNPRSPK